MADGQDTPTPPAPLSVTEFAQRIKSRFPQYQSLDDSDLVEKLVRKNPIYADQVQLPDGFSLLHTTTGHPKLDSLYEQAGRQQNVDPNLLLEQSRQESVKFSPNVIYGRTKSPKGASGISQFMPDTARSFGLRVDDKVDERNDPRKAIPAQAKYMRSLLDEFGNNEDLALAGYNAGEHRQSLRNGQIPNLPETQNYVKTIGNNLSKSRSKAAGTLKSLLSQIQQPTQPEVQQPALQTPEGVAPDQAQESIVQPNPAAPTITPPSFPETAPVVDAALQTPAGRVLANTALQDPQTVQQLQALTGAPPSLAATQTTPEGQVKLENGAVITPTGNGKYQDTQGNLFETSDGKQFRTVSPTAPAAPLAKPTSASGAIGTTPQQQAPQPPDNAELQSFAADLRKYSPNATDADVLKAYNLMKQGEATSQNQQTEQYNQEQRQATRQQQKLASQVIRQPSKMKLVGGSGGLSDEEIGNTSIQYEVPTPGKTVAEKVANARAAFTAKLKQEFGLTDEQVSQLSFPQASHITAKDTSYPFQITRNQLADLGVSGDLLRKDVRKEQTDVQTSPEYLAQQEKNRQETESKSLPVIAGHSWDDMTSAQKEVLQSPFNLLLGSIAGKTDQQMIDELQQYQPTAAEQKEYEKQNAGLAADLASPGVGGAALRGTMSAANATGQFVFGAIKAIGENNPNWKSPAWLTSLVKEGNMLDATIASGHLKNPGFTNEAVETVTGLVGSAPRYVLLGKALGGRPFLFATDAALTAKGQGAGAGRQLSAISKGVVFDSVFASAPKVAQYVESNGLEALKDFRRPTAGTAPALEGEVAKGPIVAGAYPAERLAAKVFGTGASLGYVTAAGATASRTERAIEGKQPNTFADLTSGVKLAIMQVAAEHGGDVADTISDMAGKIYRGMKGNETVAATVMPDGEIKLLKGTVPGEAVDMDFVFDPKDNLYKATNPFEHQPKQLTTDLIKTDEGTTAYKEGERGQVQQQFEDAQRIGEQKANEARQRSEMDQAKIDAEAAKRRAEEAATEESPAITAQEPGRLTPEPTIPRSEVKDRPYTHEDMDREMAQMFPSTATATAARTSKIEQTAFETAQTAGQVPAVREPQTLQEGAVSTSAGEEPPVIPKEAQAPPVGSPEANIASLYNQSRTDRQKRDEFYKAGDVIQIDNENTVKRLTENPNLPADFRRVDNGGFLAVRPAGSINQYLVTPKFDARITHKTIELAGGRELYNLQGFSLTPQGKVWEDTNNFQVVKPAKIELGSDGSVKVVEKGILKAGEGIVVNPEGEAALSKPSTQLAQEYQQAFAVPTIGEDKATRAQLNKPVQVTYETPSGRSLAKTMTAADRQKQIQSKVSALSKLVDCIHANHS